MHDFEIDDDVEVEFDTSVDDGRVNEASVDRFEDDAVVVEAAQTDGPFFHIHPDGRLDLESKKADVFIEDFGANAEVR